MVYLRRVVYLKHQENFHTLKIPFTKFLIKSSVVMERAWMYTYERNLPRLKSKYIESSAMKYVMLYSVGIQFFVAIHPAVKISTSLTLNCWHLKICVKWHVFFYSYHSCVLKFWYNSNIFFKFHILPVIKSQNINIFSSLLSKANGWLHT